jgi:hypothetical protein
MLRVAACVVVALAVVSCAFAQQMGGPSGPAAGEWRIGVESNWRCNMDATLSGTAPGMVRFPVELKQWTQQGSIEYGITDRLSIRGKAGMTRLEFPQFPWAYIVSPGPDLLPAHFNYGFSWSGELQYRICAPEEHGTALALRGRYSQARPDDFDNNAVLQYRDLEIEEWNVALLAGVPRGRVRPYAGVAYSDWEADLTSIYLGLVPDISPGKLEKDKHVGAIVGLDWDFCESSFLNVEAHVFDESGITTGVTFRW